MILQHSGETTLTCKSGSAIAVIHHDGRMQVSDRPLEGPGEYDIAGIGIHVYPTHAILFSEGIRVAIFWQAQAGQATAEGEESEIDICIPLLTDIKTINDLLKEQDPRIVVIHDEGVATELAKQDGVTPKRENSIKITPQTLPTEEREYILLS